MSAHRAAPRNANHTRLALIALTLTSLTSCTSWVTPPKHLVDPVRIYVLREALHLGLVIPAAGTDPSAAGFVEFGYGEWSWYARGQNSWYRVFPTMLWPTASTLSRRPIEADSHEDLLARTSLCGIELDPLDVERSALDDLRRELEGHFSGEREDIVYLHDYSLGSIGFVPLAGVKAPWSGAYWLPNTCADVVARWLQSLGCSVTWRPVRSILRVEPLPDLATEPVTGSPVGS